MSTARRSGPDDDPWGDRPDGGGQDASAPRGGLLGGTTRLSLFGEVGMVGLMVMVLSLPVVHLRRHLSGEPDSFGRMVRGFGQALRDLWVLGLVVPLVLLLTGYNLWLTWSGALPGGPLIGVVSAGAGAAALVVALRAGGTWYPGAGGWAAVRAAGLRAGRDVTGSVLLVVAVALCGVLIWMLEALVLLVGGLLAMAAVAVEHRYVVGTGGTGGPGTVADR